MGILSSLRGKKKNKPAAKKAAKKTAGKPAKKATKKVAKKSVAKSAKKTVPKKSAKTAAVPKTAKSNSSPSKDVSEELPPKAKAKPLRKPRAPSPRAKKGRRIVMGQEVDSEGRPYCREPACEFVSTLSGYCRLHYIKNWKKIKRKELILKEKKLNRYIEELVAKYPEKYVEVIRQDLSSDSEFAKIVQDLELGESSFEESDSDLENIDSLIDNIRRDVDDDDGDLY